jgi:hypothetical protein
MQGPWLVTAEEPPGRESMADGVEPSREAASTDVADVEETASPGPPGEAALPSEGPKARHVRARDGLVSFLMYLAGSILIWGIPVIGHLGSRYAAIDRFGDKDYFRWALTWTPWAIGHGDSPLHTAYVFAPNGLDLTWSTLVPGPALAAWPITAVFGSLVSYNLLILVAPALAAWGAYLVCRRITDRFWPSVAGGWLFGFSAHMAAQMQSHVNLVLIFPIPVAVYLVIRSVEGSLGPWAFVGLLTMTLLGSFSISTEVFATTALFGTIAFVVAWVFAGEDRARIVHAALLTVAALAIVCAVIFVPYVVPALTTQPPNLVRSVASTDLLGFIVPRHLTFFGGRMLASVSERFTARVNEDGSYLGIAGIALLVGFGITERGRRGTVALLSFIGIVALLSLGSVLRIAGRPTIAMPGWVLAHLPLIKNAAPDRFPVYLALAVGVIAAVWLARARGRAVWIRWPIVLAMALMVLPSVRTPPWHPRDRTPAFFSSGTYADHLEPNENVAVIGGSRGENMSWQAIAGFTFRMPWGYVGVASLEDQGASTGDDLFAEGQHPHPTPGGFARALVERGVTAVVVADTALPTYEDMIRSAGLVEVYVGEGVSVWRFP